jgi:predicted nucleic acid-binding protein
LSLFALDTNVVVYAFVDDHRKEMARSLLTKDPCLSVQVLNEFTRVARRKLKLGWPKVDEAVVELVRLSNSIVSLTTTVHHQGRRIAERYRLGIYDALIIAAALEGGCETLFSEDMQDGLVIDNRLTVRNPFGETA